MSMSPAELDARERLAQCARALHKLDLYGLSGHISLRIPDSDLILITPGGGLDKTRLRASDLTTMDAGGRRVAGPHPPPLETAIHVAVHAARPELDSIAHLHSHWCTVFSVTDVPFEPILLPARGVGGPLPTFDRPALVTTPELAQELNAQLGQAAAILMRWHGVTVVGLTLDEMFHRAIFMEENARLLWEARALGNLVPLPPGDHNAGRLDPSETSRRTLQYYANMELPTDEQIHSGASGEGGRDS